MTTSQMPSCRPSTPVKTGQRPSARLAGNRLKLAAFIRLFDIPLREVAKSTGYSRCYIQRAISADDAIKCSSEFLLRLESSLPDLLRRRRRAFFEVPSTAAADAEAILQQL